MAGGSEPFPPLPTASDRQFRPANGDMNATRRRRKSSILGSELRVGDTGAPSLATGIAHLNGSAKESPSPTTSSKRFSKRRKARSALRRAKSIAVKHTWVLPLVLLLILLSLYAVNPTESNPIHHFIFLSYKLPVTNPDELPQYGKGLWDIAFVAFYTIVLSFTREFIMQEILRPMARWHGLKSRGKQARYMEQMYTALYFGILGPTGMYVMSRTPVWYFNTRGMYENFPHKTHDAVFKFYYLFQAAYWAQQAIVLLLGMEKPRKDFKELVGHHIVSLALIGLSYRFHFTYMGLAVYITHDISDFFLAVRSSSPPPPPPRLKLASTHAHPWPAQRLQLCRVDCDELPAQINSLLDGDGAPHSLWRRRVPPTSYVPLLVTPVLTLSAPVPLRSCQALPQAKHTE
ncbi:hypothetical protein VTI74DRAFT_7593 [Chaetomium olivicolor]